MSELIAYDATGRIRFTSVGEDVTEFTNYYTALGFSVLEVTSGSFNDINHPADNYIVSGAVTNRPTNPAVLQTYSPSFGVTNYQFTNIPAGTATVIKNGVESNTTTSTVNLGLPSGANYVGLSIWPYKDIYAEVIL